jgi:hypothetical protein
LLEMAQSAESAFSVILSERCASRRTSILFERASRESWRGKIRGPSTRRLARDDRQRDPGLRRPSQRCEAASSVILSVVEFQRVETCRPDFQGEKEFIVVGRRRTPLKHPRQNRLHRLAAGAKRSFTIRAADCGLVDRKERCRLQNLRGQTHCTCRRSRRKRAFQRPHRCKKSAHKRRAVSFD